METKDASPPNDATDNATMFRRLSQIAREARAAVGDTEWTARINAERDEIRRTLAARGYLTLTPHTDSGAMLTHAGAAFLAQVHGVDIASALRARTSTEKAD